MKLSAVGRVAALAGVLASCAPLPPAGNVPAPPAPSSQAGPGPKAAPVAAFQLDREPSIDVGLAWDLDSLSVAPTRPVEISRYDRGGPVPLGQASLLRARVNGDGWRLEWRQADGKSVVMSEVLRDTVWVGDEASGSPGPGSDAREPRRSGSETGLEPLVRWNGKTWRGRFKIFIGPRGKLTLAVRVPLETYLVGVVPGEIGSLSDELVQAGRAQAIAARSYTLFYLGRRGSEGFDLYGTVEDQLYLSVEAEKPLASRCVRGTLGYVALSGGRPIRANYCSTCGGITADVWEAWPSDPLSYLVSVPDRGGTRDYCADSPVYRWREEWTAQQFLAEVGRFGPPEGIALPERGIGELVDVRAEARSHSGRVWRLVIDTTTGEIVVPAYSLRRVLRRPGAEAILRSNLFKIDVRRDPATRKALAVVASGAGSGHGVGLCQTGARAMARGGLSAERILSHYYPGTELKRLY